jgi:two-component system response regulator DesR
MRRLIAGIVGDLAVRVAECADGAEALQAYRTHEPDWVLMDIGMKGLDGLSATRQIRNAFPDARIVIVTEYDNPVWRDEARDAGAVEYVLKDHLWDIRRILQRPPGDRP